MTYRPIDTAPRDVQVIVLTRARNVRGYWHDTDLDPPTHWWDDAFPGAPTGRIKPPQHPRFYPGSEPAS